MKFLLLTEAFAVTTFALGWWAVPLLAIVWAAFVDTRRPVFFATTCAATAWAAVLLLDAARGPVDTVAARFAAILGLPPIVLIVVTVLFAALLAWSASCVGAAIRKSLFGKAVDSPDAPTAPQQPVAAGEVAVADV